MQKLLSTSLLFSLVSVTLYANVSIVSTSYQEQVEITPSGKKEKVWVKAEKVVPGTIIKYVNVVENSGSFMAKNLVIRNAIPKDMTYVLNSAQCQSSCVVRYSVDGGLTYHYPSALYVGEGIERHLAKASEYTNIRWRLNLLDAQSQSSVEYKARLK